VSVGFLLLWCVSVVGEAVAPKKVGGDAHTPKKNPSAACLDLLRSPSRPRRASSWTKRRYFGSLPWPRITTVPSRGRWPSTPAPPLRCSTDGPEQENGSDPMKACMSSLAAPRRGNVPLS
jgi:hypothetical protein